MIEQIRHVIEQADEHGLLDASAQHVLTGYSGKKIIGMLQGLVALFAGSTDTCYLEVGVFQGLTLLSVAATSPTFPCYGIDNFAYFDPEKKNLNLVQERRAKLHLDNAHIINKDYEDALEALPEDLDNRQVALYFVDGPHDYRSQLMCLQLALPYLHNQAVIVVDDANYQHVRQANRDFLVTHQDFKLLFEAYTPAHPANMDEAGEAQMREEWWNGINVIVKDPDNLLPPMYPPTERSRRLYENEHIIHAAAQAEYAPQALQLIQEAAIVRWDRFLFRLLRLYPKLRKDYQQHKTLFPLMNTYSEGLPAARFNASPDAFYEHYRVIHNALAPGMDRPDHDDVGEPPEPSSH